MMHWVLEHLEKIYKYLIRQIVFLANTIAAIVCQWAEEGLRFIAARLWSLQKHECNCRSTNGEILDLLHGLLKFAPIFVWQKIMVELDNLRVRTSKLQSWGAILSSHNG